MGKGWLQLLAALVLVFGFTCFASAEESGEFDQQMIELTKEAAEVQLSLSDKGYSIKEVKEKLSPYFTETFINQFIAINMMKDSDGLYYVMGTDFPIYYIPFFLYEGETWVMTNIEGSQVAVYEYYPASTEGPVGYDSHYEAVIYAWDSNQWKVKEINPQFDPNQFEVVAKEAVQAVGQTGQENSKTAEVAGVAEKAQSFAQTVLSFFTRLLE